MKIPLNLLFFIFFFSSCNQNSSDNKNNDFKWEFETLESLTTNKNLLEDFKAKIQDSTLYGVDALVIVKDEKIVFEEYFNGYTADSLHDIRSAGKSITSALVGIAIKKDFIASDEETIIENFKPDYSIDHLSPEKEQIQIKHLLTMSAGWDCDDWNENSLGNTMHLPGLPDDFGFILNLPMIKSNGESFSYCSGGANLLGEIIRRKSQMSLKDFANKYLINRIGITNNEWFIAPDPQNYEFSGGGNFLRPRDLARFGLLYLNGGQWQGEQVIPKEWIRKSTEKQIETGDDGDYGYLWWIKKYRFKNRVVNGFEASGNGGNKITVVPELNMVIILTGSAYGSEYVEGEQAKTIIEDYVLASFEYD